MKKKKSGIGGFFKEFGEAVVKGDLFVKLSLVWMGAGYIRRKQIIKGSHCIYIWLCHRVCT